MKKKRKSNGFTLVEIIVVAIIIAMLSSFIAPKVFQQLGKAKRDIAKAGVNNISGCLENYAIECDGYPTEADGGLDALINKPPDLTEDQWESGPYIKASQLIDPWKEPYIYLEVGEINVNSFDVISFGPDRQAGGEGTDADIVND